MSNGIDLSQYPCTQCWKQGVCCDAVDTFVAQLCQVCYDKLWAEYCEAVDRILLAEEREEKMKETKTTPQSEWEMGDFFLHVYGDRTVLEIKDLSGFILNVPHDHADIVQAFLQWLRDVDKETQMKVCAAIVLEYQVAAHIHTKSEEDHLADINMTETPDLIARIQRAVRERAIVDENRVYVSVQEVQKYLQRDNLLLPAWVVYTVLKTLEEVVPGSCNDVGQGYFTLRQSFLDNIGD